MNDEQYLLWTDDGTLLALIKLLERLLVLQKDRRA